ncbi:hypothetical protein CPHO_05960 [Corynebacterium phocae]|uniref:NlpC/P60 domain-containing protein n=1 Tax=Corynebacterium phocae TaxID=161895 RepID=A0A1L7D332_9CORY|nr:NlpC/P60 family protein [Corynebacterium phocae]APT92510.1 hypothetical protein CPHO_05960 [Corynebacterium phocae]KAA8725114.1 hydrolase [Corynebacterium phocae]
MATTYRNAYRNRKPKPTFRLRSFLAAASCTAIVSLVTSVTPAPVQAQTIEQQLLRDIDKAIRDGAGSIPELAGALADIQSEISRLDSTIGAHREAVNRALVDLQDARTELLQAQKGTSTAKSELQIAEDAVALAQRKLDELARSAFRRANTSESVSRAAGQDSRQKMLERQSFLKVQTSKQREVVKELERVRTEKANKESQLRKVEQLAQDREQQAAESEQEARNLLSEASARVQEVMGQRETLLAKQQQAEAALSSFRGEMPDEKDQGSNKAGENSVDPSGNDAVAAPQPAAPIAAAHRAPAPAADATPAATSPAAGGDNSTDGAGNAGTPQDNDLAGSSRAAIEAVRGVTAGVGGDKAPFEGLTADAGSIAPDAAGSSLSNEEMAVAGVAVFGAAAAIVAASQPEHAALSSEMGSSRGNLKALQGVLSATSQVLKATDSRYTNSPSTTAPQASHTTVENSTGQAGAQARTGGLTDDLNSVLEALDNTLTVTEEATEIVADQGEDALIEAVIARAQSQVGVNYAWGGGDANGPTRGIRDGGVADSYGDFDKVGFDCSGLILYAFAGAGIALPHYSGYQYNHGRRVPASQMKRGDLLFYGPGGNQHVAIYLGDGTMIEAPESGGHVRIAPVRYAGMTSDVVRLIG